MCAHESQRLCRRALSKKEPTHGRRNAGVEDQMKSSVYGKMVKGSESLHTIHKSHRFNFSWLSLE